DDYARLWACWFGAWWPASRVLLLIGRALSLAALPAAVESSSTSATAATTTMTTSSRQYVITDLTALLRDQFCGPTVTTSATASATTTTAGASATAAP